MAKPHQVKYWTVQDETGKTNLSSKCHIFEQASRGSGPTVFHVLRDYVVTLGYTGDFYLNQWLKETRTKREEFVGFFGLHAEDLRRSIRSAEATPGYERSGFEMQEYTVSTELLVHYMTDWVSWMRGERRTRAKEVQSVFIASVLGDRLGRVSLAPPGRSGRCKADSTNADWCRHIRPLAGRDHHGLPRLLCELHVAARKCPVCKEWYKALVRDIARHGDERLTGAALPQLPTGMPVLRGAKRARRLDSAIMSTDAVAVRKTKKRRVSTHYYEPPVALATPDKDLAERRMACYLHRGNEEFSEVRQVSVCIDAATIGKRDILVGAVYSHKKDTAMWLPPQVSGLGLHTQAHLWNRLPLFRDLVGKGLANRRRKIDFEAAVAPIRCG